jgi:hypothetical protein
MSTLAQVTDESHETTSSPTAALLTTAITEEPSPLAQSQSEDDKSEEPQNALTAAFTKAEWNALAEFRVGHRFTLLIVTVVTRHRTEIPS